MVPGVADQGPKAADRFRDRRGWRGEAGRVPALARPGWLRFNEPMFRRSIGECSLMPQREFNSGGWRPMERYKIRNTWRGAVLEGL